MDIKKSAAEIVKYVGGEENVSQLTHCLTRLRFMLKDNSKVDMDRLGSVEGVLTAQIKAGQTQVVIGAKVESFYNQIVKDFNITAGGEVGEDGAADNGKKEKRNPIGALAETIASMFTPFLPALTACGMIQCILNIAVLFGLDSSTSTYAVLNMMGQLVFYFLPFLLAVTAADKLKTNRAMAMLLAGGYIYFSTKLVGDDPVSFLGIPFRSMTYTSTVIPILLSVFVLKYVYDFINKLIPEMLRVILVPMLVLLIMIPLQLAVLGPIGAYIGTYLAKAFDWLFSVSGLFAGALLGFFRPILVMFGMHYSLMPIQIQQVAETGMSTMFISSLCANIAQSGAALGVALKTKNPTMRTAGFSSSLSALFGITEPAIYGVNLRYKKPFFCACTAAAISGGILGLLGGYATSIVLPGILSIPVFNTNAGFIWVPIMVAASFIMACVFTYVVGFDEK